MGRLLVRSLAKACAGSRPQAIGADEAHAGRIAGARIAEITDRDAALRISIEQLDWRAQFDGDVGMVADCCEQRRLQVAAMDDPIRRTVILLRAADGKARQIAPGGRLANADGFRGDQMRPQALFEAELDQNARRIGGRREARLQSPRAALLVPARGRVARGARALAPPSDRRFRLPQ